VREAERAAWAAVVFVTVARMPGHAASMDEGPLVPSAGLPVLRVSPYHLDGGTGHRNRAARHIDRADFPPAPAVGESV
jgi:hypothetical protein